jgi:hypothetical protein
VNEGLFERLTAPQPIERLEFVRMLAPLAILGFLSSRFIHVSYWLTDVGFVAPAHADSTYRLPMYIPPIPVWLAYAVVLATVASGLATSAGFRTRSASGVFAFLLAYLALADRLEAFTVSKLGMAVAVALFATPCGARYGFDAWHRVQASPGTRLPTHVTWGNVRFFQLLLIFMYTASGIAKMKGDWLSRSDILWTHLHDSYQTPISYFLACNVPPGGWTFFQGMTLIYETGASIWYGVRRTRVAALFVGLGMHAGIGLMFGPVIWFSLLMSTLLLGSFAPASWLERWLRRVWETRTPSSRAQPA